MNWKLMAIGAVGIALGSFAIADESGEETHDYASGTAAEYFETGVPENPSEAWLLAEGGRMYDNWYNTLGRDAPDETNPVYPTDVSGREGAQTWRCKECHGWDYRGADGVYGHGSHFTGIAGITAAAGRPVEEIALILRDENHPYTQDMISDEEMLRVAAFVSRGQVDMTAFSPDRYILKDLEAKAKEPTAEAEQTEEDTELEELAKELEVDVEKVREAAAVRSLSRDLSISITRSLC